MNLRPTRLPLTATLILALSLAACAKKQEAAAIPAIPPTELAAIDTPPTAYPAEAECDRAGRTEVRGWTIGKGGVPEQVPQAQVSGHAALGKAAMEAVRTWTFRAATRNGQPVTHTITVPVTFPPVLEKPTRCFAQGG